MKNIEQEFEVVKNTNSPNTVETLINDFKALGVEEGSIIIMHSSLTKLGWTVGGPISVIRAIMEVLTKKGTLIMPTFTGGNSEPSRWENPPVPESWWEIIRQTSPAFDPLISPTRGMGIIVETFRRFPGVIRSNHPISSFAAWGKYAKKITRDHKLEYDLGEHSPLAKIYDLNGQILLLGVTHLNNSSLHLAEYRCNYYGKRFQSQGSSIMENGQRKWVIWEELDLNPDDFGEIGRDFEISKQYKPKKVGLADAYLFSQREIVDYAVQWMETNRIE
ncbi:MAG: aminoglycoside N(3)-acetyltransferase [Promethearchaeota archaeon]